MLQRGGVALGAARQIVGGRGDRSNLAVDRASGIFDLLHRPGELGKRAVEIVPEHFVVARQGLVDRVGKIAVCQGRKPRGKEVHHLFLLAQPGFCLGLLCLCGARLRVLDLARARGLAPLGLVPFGLCLGGP